MTVKGHYIYVFVDQKGESVYSGTANGDALTILTRLMKKEEIAKKVKDCAVRIREAKNGEITRAMKTLLMQGLRPTDKDFAHFLPQETKTWFITEWMSFEEYMDYRYRKEAEIPSLFKEMEYMLSVAKVQAKLYTIMTFLKKKKYDEGVYTWHFGEDYKTSKYWGIDITFCLKKISDKDLELLPTNKVESSHLFFYRKKDKKDGQYDVLFFEAKAISKSNMSPYEIFLAFYNEWLKIVTDVYCINVESCLDELQKRYDEYCLLKANTRSFEQIAVSGEDQ